MRIVNLLGVMAVSYNIGHGDLRAAVSCAALWAILQVAWNVDRRLRAAERPDGPSMPPVPYDWATDVDIAA